jgi:predicted Zn-dependent protease
MDRSSRRNFLSLACKWGILSLGAAPVLSSIISGCKTLETLAESGPSFQIGDATVDTKAIAKETLVVTNSVEDFTPQQEYYIGRTVGATILQKYKPYNNPKADRYINVMGQMLAQASDCPETYGGYHFLIQDSDEINAFAAPGGFIFMTRGMLRCCPQEDAVAAVLAHEIGHVQYKHGLRAIKQSRVTSALTALAIKGAKNYGDEDLAELTKDFEGSISDITKTLIVNGYSRSFENQADLAAISILQRTGYNSNGLVTMLNQMKSRLKPGRQDFAATHPTPDSRLADIQQYIGKYSTVKSPQARQNRFKAALGKI